MDRVCFDGIEATSLKDVDGGMRVCTILFVLGFIGEEHIVPGTSIVKELDGLASCKGGSFGPYFLQMGELCGACLRSPV